MRILMLNNKYLLHGGEEVVFQNEIKLLRGFGCTVDTFVQDNERVAELGKLKTSLRAIWSSESYQQVRKMLQAEKYDAVHVHNHLPLLSPSVYYAARAEGVPVVQTLHNYRLMCPVGTFFRNGSVCEDCLNKFVPWNGVYHGCYRDSRGATAVVAAMLGLHRGIGTWRNLVDAYIVLSEFQRRKFIDVGLPEDKVYLKPNFLAEPPAAKPGGGGYAIFVGRICEEKGVRTLLNAWRKIGSKLPLKICGTGPLTEEVEQAVKDIDGVEYLGFQEQPQIYELIGNADCIVLPSQWYEGQPVVVIEALALGTPLVVSKIGPIPEFIDDKKSGLLFDTGDADDLAAKIEWLLEHRDKLPEMRANARNTFEERHTPERNFAIFKDIYRAAKRRRGDSSDVAANTEIQPKAESSNL